MYCGQDICLVFHLVGHTRILLGQFRL